MSLNICVPFDQASQSTSQMNLYQQTAPFLFYGSIASGIAWIWKRYAVSLTNKIFRIPISTMTD